jgi:hypothetical protein
MLFYVGAKLLSLTLKDESGLRISNRMFGIKTGTREWRKLHSEDLHKFSKFVSHQIKEDERGGILAMHGTDEEYIYDLAGKNLK